MRNRSVLLLVAATLLASGAGLCQTPASGPIFDVASVRSAAPIDQATMLAGLRVGKRPESVTVEGTRATFKYESLKELISYGYKVRPFQVTGPDWLTTDRFDVNAKLPEGATRDDVPAMLKALLIERFHLAAHLETSEHPVLGLTLAKGATKLKEVAVAPSPLNFDEPLKPGQQKVDSIDGPLILTRNIDGTTTYDMGERGKFTLKIDGDTGTMHMTGAGMTVKGLAMMLTSLGGGNGRPVVDMTGLTGHYELAADFALSDLVASLHDQGIDIPVRPGSTADPSEPGGSSTLSDALATQGLRLEKSKAMIEQLVIDHIEKLPTDN